ncbi:MAG: hypothetical protein R3229_13120 [Alphaproteobacteria bacterium]|nr:hypothetical protein [Alphaproteobacteria bacterium]
MVDMIGYSGIEVLVMVLLFGGAITFLVGLLLPVTPGLHGYKKQKPIMPVGAGLCLVGAILGMSFSVFW